MLAEDEREQTERELLSRINRLQELIVTTFSPAGTPPSAMTLMRRYQRAYAIIAGLPYDEEEGRDGPKPDETQTEAWAIEQDPWFGGLVRQAVEVERERLLGIEKAQGIDTAEGVRAAMERARTERDTLLREVDRPAPATGVESPSQPRRPQWR